MMNQEKNFSDLDLDLMRLANADWPTFTKIVGEDAIIKAKICILRSRGKSIRQISQRLNISKDKSEYNCSQCPTSVKETVGR